MRRRPGWLRKMLESGELAKAARRVDAKSLVDVARAINATPDAFYCAREQLKQDDIEITIESLLAQAPAPRWETVAKFDRGELDEPDEPRIWQPSDFRNPEVLPYVHPHAPTTRKLTREECPDGTVALWVSDVHVPIHNVAALDLMMECAEQIGVSLAIAGGDIYDFNCLSRHPKESYRAVEHATLLEEIEPGRAFINWLATKNTKLILGNHEGRAARFIDENPVFHGSVLSDFGKLVDLPAGIEVVPQGGEVRVGNLSMRHLDAEFKKGTGGKYPAHRLLDMLPAQSTIGGHLHRKAMACRTTRDEDGIQRTHAAWIMGHMSNEANHYGYVSTTPNWQTGFGIMRFWWEDDRPRFSVYQIEVLFDRYNRPFFEFEGRLHHAARMVAA